MYATAKIERSTQAPVVRQQPEQHSASVTRAASSEGRKANNSQRKESPQPVENVNAKIISILPKSPAAPPTWREKPPTRISVLNKKAIRESIISLQSSQHKYRANNALIQTRAEGNSRHLYKLIQKGIMHSGSVLQLLLKVRHTSPHKKNFYITVFSFYCHQTPLHCLQLGWTINPYYINILIVYRFGVLYIMVRVGWHGHNQISQYLG